MEEKLDTLRRRRPIRTENNPIRIGSAARAAAVHRRQAGRASTPPTDGREATTIDGFVRPTEIEIYAGDDIDSVLEEPLENDDPRGL
jgi:hypothetical protein